MSIDIFGFQALWSPYFFASLIILTVGYLLLVTKYRYIFAGNAPVPAGQNLIFTVTMLLLYIIKGSPVDLLGHIMFSVHMSQMAILYLVIAPLFIISIPGWLFRWLISIRGLDTIFNFFTIPLIALIVFNGLFSFYHIPLIFDFIKVNMWLHSTYTIVLFIAAIFMWFPLLNTLPERESLSGLKKVGYIFGSAILLTPACALIIFADHPIYHTFSNPQAWSSAMALCVPSSALSGVQLSGPELFNGLPLLEDQQLGGVLMKIIQEIVYGILLGYIFFSWYRQENGESKKIDPALDFDFVK
ncbi:cytochrome c oxidase assembly factor CtaG [Bacillus sp. MUM 13]|uniref:cytochrome c oxidase assembly factor CtaG n=1 Tax=Bacillus sp. MUM 13 TaxID=1678001 RepID=UPI0008F5F4BB|nr:cytochrome c oxidase assembly factor CtaG [Bacillus sp. MUM 13]OIK15162.1 cytochrome c oxidase assembly factor CtaG [Bacillus sp. MUM 13]